MVKAARALLHKQGRRVEELYYHTKVHPKSGEVAHLFRGKEKGAVPKHPSRTVRFVGTVNEPGVLVDIQEIGSRERKRIGSRGPVAGRVRVPHAEQKIVRRDQERKARERAERAATAATRSRSSGRGRTGRSETGTASPAPHTAPLDSPPLQAGRPSDPIPPVPKPTPQE